jgi:DNA-binding LacI/PurR family transcriptional regulator
VIDTDTLISLGGKTVLQLTGASLSQTAFACQGLIDYVLLVSDGARRVGIRQVAAAAGVSVTTVSHALNGKGRLPQETRDRVHAVAQELGYRPNATARNLAGGKTGLLGLVISQPADIRFAFSDFAYFTYLTAAASAAALDRGYALVLTPSDIGLGAAVGVAVDGAIVVDPVEGDPLVQELRDASMPLVTTGRVVGDDPGCAWVDNDHVAGTRSALDHLGRRNARRIALLTTPTVISYSVDVERAYREWCADHGMEPLVSKTDQQLTESAGYTAASELLRLPDPPDAIFASYDRLAYGALLAANARDVAVPDELMVVMTATESSHGQSSGPSVTALDLHPNQIGQRAVELLIDIVEERAEGGEVLVPTTIIPRASTKRPATGRGKRA